MRPAFNNLPQKYTEKSVLICVFCGKFLFWILLLLLTLNAATAQTKETDDTASSPFKQLYGIDIYRKKAADSLQYLIPLLDTIFENDQKYRYRRKDEEQSAAAERFNLHKKEILYIDSINVLKITAILDRYGWIDKKKIGILEGGTFFWIIQHANIDVQEKYLPMLRQAVLEKSETAHHLTMMEDRVSLRKNKYQLYGTQVFYYPPKKRFYLFPLIEPDKVNERRQIVGLSPTSFDAYLKQFNLVWNLDTYQKELHDVQRFVANSKPSDQ